MTKLKNMFGLFVLVCALCFIPNVYAEEIACDQDTAVAQVGGKCYTDLKEAIGKDGEVTVLKDTDLKASIVVKNEVTLDLNNKKVTVKNDDFNKNYSTFYVMGGTLTINGPGTIDDLVETPSHAVIGIADGSRWQWEPSGPGHIKVGAGVNINSSAVAIMIDPLQEKASASTIDFAGKITMTEKGTFALYVNGQNKVTSTYPVITVRDGAELSSESLAIYQAGYSDITIGKATISGYTGIATKSGKLTLNGTTVTGKGAKQEPDAESGKVILTGSAIQVESNSGYQTPIDITITDGNFTSLHDVAFREYTDTKNTTTVGKIEISGGTFEGQEGSLTTSENFKNSNKDHFISGGTFLKNGSNDDALEEEFLAEHLVKNANGEVVPTTVSVKVYDGTDKSKEKETKEMPYGANLLEQLKDVEWFNKSDLTFAGWYYDDAFTQKVQEGDTVSDTKTTLYAKYVVTVHYNDSSEGTDFTKEIGDVIGALVDGPAKAKKRFAGWYSDSQFENVVTAQMQLAKNITLYAKYVDTVTVTFAGVTKDPITLDKGQSLDTLAAAEAEEGYRFVGWFMDEKGTNPFVPTEPINEDTTIYAIFVKQIKITVVNENGDELELILDEGQTIKDASNYEEYLEFVNRDGKVLDGVYFEKDGEITYDKANELQYEEDTTVYPCYVFSIKVNGEEYSVDEGEMLGTLGDLSQFTKPGKTIIGFKDSEGNFYEFDYVPTSALNLTVVYEDITDVPNTLDNVQTYMMLLAAGMISILVGLGFVASKKLN